MPPEVSVKPMQEHSKLGDSDSGVKISDLLASSEFLSRRHRATENADRAALAMERLTQCRPDGSAAMLQELVQIAVDFCPADSSGISLEELNNKRELQFRWIAVAGSFARYVNCTTPRFYSPCGTCMDRGVAQHYQVNQPYYNFLGVDAQPILDGILIPWRSGSMRGTLWLVSHSSEDTFDTSDYEFLQKIADFVSKEIEKQS